MKTENQSEPQRVEETPIIGINPGPKVLETKDLLIRLQNYDNGAVTIQVNDGGWSPFEVLGVLKYLETAQEIKLIQGVTK